MQTIELRDYRISDADRLVDLANNETVSRYLIYTFPYPYTKADAVWWVNTGCKLQGSVTRAIQWNGSLVGTVGITPQTGWREHVAEIGYWLGEEYWGRGIATAAVQQMTELAFAELGFRKLFAPVLAPNRASMKVLQNNDYQLEGVFAAEVIKHGQYFDIHHYAKHCESHSPNA